MKTVVPLIAALAGGLLGPMSARAQNDASFEAALQKATPRPASVGTGKLRPRPAGSASRYIGVLPGKPPLAPRGTIPPKWRSLKATTEPDWLALDGEIEARRLDGLALLEQVTQPIPLPGALRVDCVRQSMQFDFTMNVDLPADLSRRLPAVRRNSTVKLQDEAERGARPMVDMLTDFFLAKGFRPFRSGIVPSTRFYNEKTRLRFDIMKTSVDAVDGSCLCLQGMKVPNGPYLRFSNDPLGPGGNFIPVADAFKFYRDRYKAPPGKVDPFG